MDVRVRLLGSQVYHRLDPILLFQFPSVFGASIIFTVFRRQRSPESNFRNYILRGQSSRHVTGLNRTVGTHPAVLIGIGRLLEQVFVSITIILATRSQEHIDECWAEGGGQNARRIECPWQGLTAM